MTRRTTRFLVSTTWTNRSRVTRKLRPIYRLSNVLLWQSLEQRTVSCFYRSQMGKSYQRQHSGREICTTLMFVASVKWQFVNFKDFSRYPLLLPPLASDALQNVPFCSGERGLQGHPLLAAVTPSPRQLCLASSHLLLSLLLIQKVRFVRENCIFFSQSHVGCCSNVLMWEQGRGEKIVEIWKNLETNCFQGMYPKKTLLVATEHCNPEILVSTEFVPQLLLEVCPGNNGACTRLLFEVCSSQNLTICTLNPKP